MAYGIFREIERLVEYIPIEVDTYRIGKLAPNTFIDSKYNFKDIDGIATRLGILEVGKNTISLRDIIKLLNKFLKHATIDELVENPRRYRELQKSSSGIPLKNLLFDFCLSALVSDIFNAKLFLTHSLYLTENIKETININKSLISPHNNEFINWLHHSRVKTLKWVLDQNDHSNLKVLKKIVLSKISMLKKEKKKAIYRIDTIRIIEEIDSLEFCLNAIVQDIYKINFNKEA